MSWRRFFFGRRRRKPQSYRQYARSRRRREAYAGRYAAEHPRPGAETFSATIRLADGREITCEHAHKSRGAARKCGERMAGDYPGLS